jgi:hypothetical protein
MPKKTAFNVTVRRRDTGEDLTLLSIADGPKRAGEHAIENARRKLKGMADREYAVFEVVACVAARAE